MGRKRIWNNDAERMQTTRAWKKQQLVVETTNKSIQRLPLIKQPAAIKQKAQKLGLVQRPQALKYHPDRPATPPERKKRWKANQQRKKEALIGLVCANCQYVSRPPSYFLLIGQTCNICRGGKLQQGELAGWIYNPTTRKAEPSQETSQLLRQIKKSYRVEKEGKTPKCLTCRQKPVNKEGQNCFSCQHDIDYQQWREKQVKTKSK